MKKKPPLSRKQLILFILFFLLFCLLTLFLFNYKRDERNFARITTTIFQSEMLSDTLNMHYTLANPDNFGIRDYRPVLSCYQENSPTQAKETIQSLLRSLNAIHKDKLNFQDQKLYTLLLRHLENSLKLNQYYFYCDPLSSYSGMQSQLPILLAEYAFRSKSDIDDYLSLLEQTKTYYLSLLSFQQDKIKSGLLLNPSSIRGAKEQCDTIVTSEALEKESHFLQTSFQERIASLVESGQLTSSEATEFIRMNNRLLKTVLLPAYTQLADGLTLLENDTTVNSGLSNFPDGKDYYRYLMISETGSYRSISQIRDLLSSQLIRESNHLHTIFEQNPDLAQRYQSGDGCNFPAMNEKESLKDILTRMSDIFPAISKPAPHITIKDVSKNLEPYCAPAFYLTAPLDDTSHNVIYINQSKTLSGLDLYTTLAHEGYPGHLYQTVYHCQHMKETKERPLLRLLWYGGYLEGWALYTEFYAYDFAKELLEENDQKNEAVYVEIEKHSRSLQLCLYSLLDIMIHYDNASYKEISGFLEQFGISERQAIHSIYWYITSEPCNYLKYYLGYLEILDLKNTAKELWMSEYSEFRFHKFLLDYGPADFLSLREFLLDHTVQVPSVP